MEGGTSTTCEELLSRQPHYDQYPEVDIGDLPTLCDVEKALRATKCGKGMGHDGLPGDILHMAASEVAYMIWPLFLKQSLTRCESLQFKGGRLVTAYKRRGDPVRITGRYWCQVVWVNPFTRFTAIVCYLT